MRIIYESTVAGYKVTGFVNGLKYSCKIESPVLELILKLPEHPNFSETNAVIRYIQTVLEPFLSKQLHLTESAIFQLLQHHLSAPAGEEEII